MAVLKTTYNKTENIKPKEKANQRAVIPANQRAGFFHQQHFAKSIVNDQMYQCKISSLTVGTWKLTQEKRLLVFVYTSKSLLLYVLVVK